MNERRGHWYLLTGLVIGALIGLLYSWLVQPVQYTNTTPASLRKEFKDKYRVMIANAYMANGDLVRAKARLELLKDEDVYQVLAEQAQRSLADGSSPEEARALGLLAVALGQGPPTLAPPTVFTAEVSPSGAIPSPVLGTPDSNSPSASPTGPLSPTLSTGTLTTDVLTPTLGTPASGTRTPQPTSTLLPTITPLPSRTPTPTQGAPFVLESQDLVCDRDQVEGLIQVRALDAAGGAVPGAAFVITWEGGEDHFFTGLKPELGLDYADYWMTPGVVYTLQPVGGGQQLPNLTAPECETNRGARYWGGWQVVFTQP
jgi:hypothetical protein